MINNEFHLIGTCVSGFRNIGNNKFACYSIRLEVEKTNGSVFELDAIVYSTNRQIDVNDDILGKQVAINGFCDSFKQEDGNTRTKLVCQNLLVLDGHKRNVSTSVRVPSQTNAPNQAQVKKETAVELVKDDEMPF